MTTPSHPAPPDGCPFFRVRNGELEFSPSAFAIEHDAYSLSQDCFPAKRFAAGSAAYVWMLRDRGSYYNDPKYHKLANVWLFYTGIAGDEMEGKTRFDMHDYGMYLKAITAIKQDRADMEASNG